MRFTDGKFIVPQAIAAGTPMNVENMAEKEVVIGGTFVASLDVEISLDGSTWIKVITGATVPAAAESVLDLAKFMRVKVTAYTSGQPIVRIYGRTTRDG